MTPVYFYYYFASNRQTCESGSQTGFRDGTLAFGRGQNPARNIPRYARFVLSSCHDVHKQTRKYSSDSYGGKYENGKKKM